MEKLHITRTKEGAVTYPEDNNEWKVLARTILRDLKDLTPRQTQRFEKMIARVTGQALTVEQIKKEIKEDLEELDD